MNTTTKTRRPDHFKFQCCTFSLPKCLVSGQQKLNDGIDYMVDASFIHEYLGVWHCKKKVNFINSKDTNILEYVQQYLSTVTRVWN